MSTGGLNTWRHYPQIVCGGEGDCRNLSYRGFDLSALVKEHFDDTYALHGL